MRSRRQHQSLPAPDERVDATADALFESDAAAAAAAPPAGSAGVAGSAATLSLDEFKRSICASRASVEPRRSPGPTGCSSSPRSGSRRAGICRHQVAYDPQALRVVSRRGCKPGAAQDEVRPSEAWCWRPAGGARPYCCLPIPGRLPECGSPEGPWSQRTTSRPCLPKPSARAAVTTAVARNAAPCWRESANQPVVRRRRGHHRRACRLAAAAGIALNPANGLEGPLRVAQIDEQACIGCAKCCHPARSMRSSRPPTDDTVLVRCTGASCAWRHAPSTHRPGAGGEPADTPPAPTAATTASAQRYNAPSSRTRAQRAALLTPQAGRRNG